MTSTTTKILLALHAAAFILAGPSKFCVMASPVSISSTRAPLVANRLLHDQPNATSDVNPRDSMVFTRRAISADLRSSSPTMVPHTSTAYPLRRRGDPRHYYNLASENYNDLQSLSNRHASTGKYDADFQRNCMTQASAYQSNLLRLQTALSELGRDKGLANYDDTNDLETILKDTINLNKEWLHCVSTLVDQLPLLGPLLGPTVYEIKCILDDLLNAVENVTDGIINDLGPSLKVIIGLASGLL